MLEAHRGGGGARRGSPTRRACPLQAQIGKSHPAVVTIPRGQCGFTALPREPRFGFYFLNVQFHSKTNSTFLLHFKA